VEAAAGEVTEVLATPVSRDEMVSAVPAPEAPTVALSPGAGESAEPATDDESASVEAAAGEVTEAPAAPVSRDEMVSALLAPEMPTAALRPVTVDAVAATAKFASDVGEEAGEVDVKAEPARPASFAALAPAQPTVRPTTPSLDGRLAPVETRLTLPLPLLTPVLDDEVIRAAEARAEVEPDLPPARRRPRPVEPAPRAALADGERNVYAPGQVTYASGIRRRLWMLAAGLLLFAMSVAAATWYLVER
jgi:hypothetical protein